MGPGFPTRSLLLTSLHPQKKVTEILRTNFHQCCYRGVKQVTLSTGSNLRRDKTLANIWAWDKWGLGLILPQAGMESLWQFLLSVGVRTAGKGRAKMGGGRATQSIPLHGVPDPLQVAAHFGVDTRLGSTVTRDITPGHNAL